MSVLVFCFNVSQYTRKNGFPLHNFVQLTLDVFQQFMEIKQLLVSEFEEQRNRRRRTRNDLRT